MRFGCFYIPSFPAWVFEQVDAAAKVAPVIVVASEQVLAVSRRLRAAGIVEGIPAERAERLMPAGTLIRHRDGELEQAAWEDVLHEINTYTPFMEPDRPGRAYFKPFGMKDVRALSARMQAQVALAPHRPTAMLAAMRTATGNVVAVRPHHVRAFLDRFEIERLAEVRGFGTAGDVHSFSEEITEQLPLFGFDTLGAAFGLAHRHLKAQFGADGDRLYRLLHPDDAESMPLYQPPPAISRAYEFDQPCSEPGEMLPALEFILKQAIAELKDNAAQRVKVTLHDRLRPTSFACRVLPEPSSDPRRLLGTIETLLGGMLISGCRVQAIELELASLRGARPTQQSLFFKRPAAAKAVEAVHRRYPDAIRRPATTPNAVFEEERSSLEAFG
jgi:hypothetical protein